VLGEIFIFCFLSVALTRRSMPGVALADRSRGLWADHEVRLAMFLLGIVPALLFLRHWWAALSTNDLMTAGAMLHAIWGALFTTMSFLTTTGFESSNWQATRAWSGLGNPGLILLGLAMVGGGIATTAGGLKLLRVYALTRHGERELDRLVHPSSIGGEGEAARRLRRGGAYVSWIFFMLFAITFAIMVAVLALLGIEFEQGLVLTVAAVTTTGPLTVHALQTPIRLVEFGPMIKFVLAVAMIVGRMEVLAILALFSPGLWRR
jgi:trk system potassium uptake protein TrkH